MTLSKIENIEKTMKIGPVPKKCKIFIKWNFQFFPVKGNIDVRLLAKFENNPITIEEFMAERTFGPKKGPST